MYLRLFFMQCFCNMISGNLMYFAKFSDFFFFFFLSFFLELFFLKDPLNCTCLGLKIL